MGEVRERGVGPGGCRAVVYSFDILVVDWSARARVRLQECMCEYSMENHGCLLLVQALVRLSRLTQLS